jgi:hypothetical protein
MATVMMGGGAKLVVPTGVLSKPAGFTILGQFDNNPALYAVATDLQWTWPAAQATFSTQGRTGATTTVFNGPGDGQFISYSNKKGRKFGGAAQFAITGGKSSVRPPPTPTSPLPLAGNLNSQAGATLYVVGVPGNGNPPCVHTAYTPGFPGTGTPACVAAIIELQPSGLAAPGGPVGVTVMTPGQTPSGPPIPGQGPIAAGTGPFHPGGPKGTVSLFTAVQGTGLNNAANSIGFPWTTGMITVTATMAGGVGEQWFLTGKDQRVASGAGALQMVSGSLSLRTTTLDNANRGWVRLVLVGPEEVPALSPVALATTAGLMLLAAGYAMRRRFSA